MTDDNFLTLQYALGLLNEKEKQAIEQTAEFKQALQQWQLYLVKLNTQVPFTQKSAERIWQNIHTQVKQEARGKRFNTIIRNWLNTWRYILSGFATLGLLLSVGLFNQLVNADSGWDIDTDLSKQQVIITATTHQHADANKKCNLWVKKGNKILRIGLMPETGKKTFTISEEMLVMIQNGEIIISLEEKENPIIPSTIDYQHKWIS